MHAGIDCQQRCLHSRLPVQHTHQHGAWGSTDMASITIRLRYNTQTGKKDLLIDYHSDEDALPMEHEQDHRAIVNDLLGKGVLAAGELGDVHVRRVRPTVQTTQQSTAPSPQEHAEEQG